MMKLTALLTACTMASCVTLVVAEDGKRSTRGNNPLSQNSGNAGSNGSTDWGGPRDGGSGPGHKDHGLDGERWQDRVPREPMWFINAGPGETNHHIHPEDNARGYAVWWRGDRAVEELIARIHKGYDVGARWFFINRPMGSTQATTNLPGASWLTIKGEKRAELPERLTRAVLDEFDEPVHIVWYVGSDQSDPRAYPGWTPETDDQFYKLGQHDTYEQLVGSRVTLGGWISTGASGLGLDSASPTHEREHFIRLFEQLNASPFKLNLYGEALPLVFDDRNRLQRDRYNGPLLDQDAIQRMPWMATTEFIDYRWPLNAASDVFPVSEDTTRMFVWFEKSSHRYGDDNDRIELVNKYLDRGLIPITYDPVMFREALRRVRPSYSTSRSAPSGGSDTGSTTGEGSNGSSYANNGNSGSAAGGSSNGSGSTVKTGPRRSTQTVRRVNTKAPSSRVTRKAPTNKLPKRYERRTASADSED